MTEFEVTCINKPDRMSTHEPITHVGNTAGNWRMAREEAVRRIDSKKEAFYTIDRGHRPQGLCGRGARRRLQSTLPAHPRGREVERQPPGAG